MLMTRLNRLLKHGFRHLFHVACQNQQINVILVYQFYQSVGHRIFRKAAFPKDSLYFFIVDADVISGDSGKAGALQGPGVAVVGGHKNTLGRELSRMNVI